jgi:hypothetical protein
MTERFAALPMSQFGPSLHRPPAMPNRRFWGIADISAAAEPTETRALNAAIELFARLGEWHRASLFSTE